MEIGVEELRDRLTIALLDFTENEVGLLEQDAHEEAISTALVAYLRNNFAEFDYHFDGQYDKRIYQNQVVKKTTEFLLSQLPESKIPKGHNKNIDIVKKQVLPDVILHDRNSPSHNFLVIEVKKTTNKNKQDRDYDILKLETFTSRDLNYRFGVFIDFRTGADYNPTDPFSMDIIVDGIWI